MAGKGFTAEQRAKALATRQANKAKKEAEEGTRRVSAANELVADPTEREQRLLAEINDLRKKLGERPEPTPSLLMPGDPPRPTGKTVKGQRLKGYKRDGYTDNGRAVLKPVFEEVDIPTYRLKINLPPVGGIDIKINGESYYHGQEYTFDANQLATVMEMIWRNWQHENSIRGTDENFYRPQQRPQISARGM